MAEEAVVEEGVETPEEPQGLSEIEQLAVEIGWNPDYEGDDAKTADEFIRDGREIQNTMRDGWRTDRKKIDQLTGKLNEMNGTIEQMSSHFKRAIENERAEARVAYNKLKAERKDAIADGDADRVDEIEMQMQVEQQKTVVPEEPTIDPETRKWLKKNEWFNEDEDLQALAIGLEKSGVPLDEITDRVKKLFPDHKLFRGTKPEKKPPVSPVEGGGKPPAKSRATMSVKDLTAPERAAMNDFISQGLYKNEKEYLKAVSE